MAREQGTFTQSANYELQKEGTIDARQFVDVFADLLNFTASNYIADGFPVTVREDSVIGGITYKRGWYQFLGGALNNANNWEFMGGGGASQTLQELVDDAQNISEVIIEFLGGNLLRNEGGVGGQLSLKGSVGIYSKSEINSLQVADIGVFLTIGGSLGSAGEALLTDGSTLYYGAYDYNNLDNLPDLSVFDNVDTFPTVGDFPAVGKEDVFYIDNSTGKLYRWNGTGYSVVAGDLALGETASTAYRGDRGKIAYDHSQAAHAPANAQKNSDIISSEITNSLGFTPENVANKATTLAGANDTTYPTTKIVADELDKKLDKVETIGKEEVYAKTVTGQQTMREAIEEFVSSAETSVVNEIMNASYTNNIATLATGTIVQGRKYVDVATGTMYVAFEDDNVLKI